jgi:hypothetical protein
MPLLKIIISKSEYDLLRQRARTEGKALKEVFREALRAHLAAGSVNSQDPIFNMFPLQTKKGRKRWTSRDHDELLYPSRS